MNIDNERSTQLCVHVVVKTLKSEKFTFPFGRPRQRIVPSACRTSSTIIFSHLFYLLFCHSAIIKKKYWMKFLWYAE